MKLELAGKYFGHLSVIQFSHRDERRIGHWICRCSCGNEVSVGANNLISGNSKSCGCVHGIRIDAPITADQLRTLVRYDRETGKFYWLVGGKSFKAGDEAGHRNKANPYVRIGFKGKSYYAQILAWLYVTGQWPEREIDHKDTHHHDNSWDNLRLATHTQNAYNKHKAARNRSGYKGVIKFRNRFTAKITVEKTIIQLGLFDTARDAALAYDAAAKRHFGNFARTNFGD